MVKAGGPSPGGFDGQSSQPGDVRGDNWKDIPRPNGHHRIKTETGQRLGTDKLPDNKGPPFDTGALYYSPKIYTLKKVLMPRNKKPETRIEIRRSIANVRHVQLFLPGLDHVSLDLGRIEKALKGKGWEVMEICGQSQRFAGPEYRTYPQFQYLQDAIHHVTLEGARLLRKELFTLSPLSITKMEGAILKCKTER